MFFWDEVHGRRQVSTSFYEASDIFPFKVRLIDDLVEEVNKGGIETLAKMKELVYFGEHLPFRVGCVFHKDKYSFCSPIRKPKTLKVVRVLTYPLRIEGIAEMRNEIIFKEFL